MIIFFINETYLWVKNDFQGVLCYESSLDSVNVWHFSDIVLTSVFFGRSSQIRFIWQSVHQECPCLQPHLFKIENQHPRKVLSEYFLQPGAGVSAWQVARVGPGPMNIKFVVVVSVLFANTSAVYLFYVLQYSFLLLALLTRKYTHSTSLNSNNFLFAFITLQKCKKSAIFVKCQYISQSRYNCLPTQLGSDCSGFGLSIAARIGGRDVYGLRSKKGAVDWMILL